MVTQTELNLEEMDEWYTAHFSELVNKYAGKAIAVVAGQVVSIADTEQEAEHLAREKYPDVIVLVLAIPTEEELVCLL